MLALSRAKPAASAAGERRSRFTWLLLTFAVPTLSGCMPAATHMASADPSDPGVKVAPVGYRSTIAPYTSLRPATPAPWRGRNEAVTPQPKQER